MNGFVVFVYRLFFSFFFAAIYPPAFAICFTCLSFARSPVRVYNIDNHFWGCDAMRNNLKSIRLAAGLTQRSLAAAAGVSWRAIQNYENGARPLESISVIRRLAAVLGCTIDDLVPPTD